MSATSQIKEIYLLPPKGEYETFTDDVHYSEKVREWGLSTTKEVKKQFLYKEKNLLYTVTVKGYEVYGKENDQNTIIIEFQDGSLTCIHPAYLKEMQASSFGKGTFTEAAAAPAAASVAENKETDATPVKRTEKVNEGNNKNEKKEKPVKLELPEDKVHFTAAVKQFAFSWNNFNEENDEVIVLEDVRIEQENPIDVGLSWCSHSKTLKKFELQPGDILEFDGKIVRKKLPKAKDAEEEFIVSEPVHYKINNPSKIKKR
ncbi:hypothetical protein [Bacillus sp. S/N-304-OC-R1]|uniref:hypothetical protein n=1 Tax=Bacillus sp. S/N-304-OC-R1 TaxID=2758034 RepID=UPI001C8D02EF|nr:hypothetical protein [Bacillus sp. S/N-304-OC-R1]MBY0120466.1 hypothetical protein [Bacillus sp. S/N-304-OC-R1]